MKKSIFALLCLVLCLAFVFAGCSGGGSGKETTTAPAAIDVDLTQLSSTMVYSEVYNMMTTPEDYEGKVVKMKGPMSILNASDTGLTYYSVIISDATACCQQGLEFVWTGHDAADYPPKDTEVTVTGVFETYYEGETMFCHLVADSVEFA